MLRVLSESWLKLAGVVILVAIVLFFKVDLRRTVLLLARADSLQIALAVVFFVPFLAAKAWRWQIILQDVQLYISFGEATKLYAMGLGAGMVTPGQVGDAAKAAYFRDRGLGRALVSILLDRLWDVLILLLLAATGTLLFWRAFEGAWIGLAAVGAACLVLLAVTASPGAQTCLFAVLRRFRPSMVLANLKPVQLSLRQITRQLAITVLATAVVYSRYWLVVSAMHVHLDVVPFVATMSLATIAALLPVSISGLGARDAVLITVAPLIGIEREQALGISTLILFLSVVNGLVGFSVWLLSGMRRTGQDSAEDKTATPTELAPIAARLSPPDQP